MAKRRGGRAGRCGRGLRRCRGGGGSRADNADLLEAALGRRTHDTLVLETEEDTSAGLEAAKLTELDRATPRPLRRRPRKGVFDDVPFTDDELAELAMAAADENAEGEPEPEPEPAPEPEKKSFWKRLFE